jgi:hypothetical protein
VALRNTAICWFLSKKNENRNSRRCSSCFVGSSRYRRKAGLYDGRVKELNATTLERDELKKLYDGLKKKR